MRDRAFGIENEFGIMIEVSPGEFLPLFKSKPTSNLPVYPEGENVIRDALKNATKNGINGWGASDVGRLWLTNGGCFYLDMGHLEWASPETRRIKDTVLLNKVGEEIATRLFLDIEKAGKRAILVKNNISISDDGTLSTSTFGCHESYLSFGENPLAQASSTHNAEENARKKKMQEERLKPLVSFLLTRQMFDGAGVWENAEYDHYCISQRALFMEKDVGPSTTSDRAIVNSRMEHHAGSPHLSGMHRLHLIVGDANMLDVATFLKIGTTALVLTLLETGATIRAKLKVHIEDSVEAIEGLSRSCDPHYRIKLEGGKTISALGIQEIFFEEARDLVLRANFESDESEEDARQTIILWEEALSALATNDMEWMVGRLDWVTKKYLADQAVEKQKGGLSPQKIRSSIDIDYHRVDEDSYTARINRASPQKRIVTDEEIARAINTPPQDTRARVRGEVVKLARARPSFCLSGIGWDSISFKFNDISPVISKFNISHPLATHVGWLEEIKAGRWQQFFEKDKEGKNVTVTEEHISCGCGG